MVEAQTGAPPGYNTWRMSFQLPSGTVLTNGACGDINDRDHDCLNDAQEQYLANKLSPRQFWDESEDCGEEQGWHPQMRFQVRPIENGTGRFVSAWSATDGFLKEVSVTFYFNHPLDCGAVHNNIGNHLGDSERVQYLLQTYDLRRFTLLDSLHNAHASTHVRPGWQTKLHEMALGLPTSDRPSVAFGENKHASWWGREPNDNDCAGAEDDPWDDCFIDNWKADAETGKFTIKHMFASWNIGEPPLSFDAVGNPVGPRFITTADGGVIVEGPLADSLDPSIGHVYSEAPSVAHPLDGQSEYWFNPPLGATRTRFCGFMCRASDTVFSDGGCGRNVQISPGNSMTFPDVPFSLPPPWASCATGLWEKLDDSPTSIQPGQNSSSLGSQPTMNTCHGRTCNDFNSGTAGICNCDDACHFMQDCCPDKQAVCGSYDNSSCENKCGRRFTDYFEVCSCSPGCDTRGDCCADINTFCPSILTHPPTKSCTGRCGGRATDGYDCACDHLCGARQDCCADKEDLCPLSLETQVGSCAGHCSPYFGAGYAGGCHCDPGCVQRGDCCMDAHLECGVAIAPNYEDPTLLFETAAQRFCRLQPKACRYLKVHYDADVAYP